MRNLLASTILLAFAACGDDNDDDVDVAGDLGEQLGQEHATQVDLEFRDDDAESIVAQSAEIMLTMDEAEIAQADLVLDVATDEDVIEYASLMIEEHTAHIFATEALLADFGLAPMDSIVAEDLRIEAAANLDLLARSPDIELEYMRLQVQMHAASFIIVDTLAELAPFPVVADFFDDTRDEIEEHRELAELILRDF